jgi:hypothetical protein
LRFAIQGARSLQNAIRSRLAKPCGENDALFVVTAR